MTLALERGGIELLERAGGDWDALLALQAAADATRSAGWLRAWWAAFGEPRRGRRAHVLLVREGGALVAGAALMLERMPAGIVLLRHLGASSHWFDPTPLVAPGRHDALEAIGREVAATPCDLVVLEDLTVGSAELAALADAIPGSTTRAQGERRHRLRVDDPPDLRRRRKETRRLARRAREAGVDLMTEVLTGRQEITRHLDEAADLVERAWRARGDASEITGPSGRRYLHAALSGLGDGQAAMTRVVAGRRLVAFDIAVGGPALAVMFRGNWDPRGGVPGAGWMSMLAMIDHLGSAGVRVIDFGKFPWPYKRALASPPHQALATLQRGHGLGAAAGRLMWRSRPRLLAARARVRTLLAAGAAPAGTSPQGVGARPPAR